MDPVKMIAPELVHRSVAAQLAWRYAQLLAALPKRETEAEAWESYAVSCLRRRVASVRTLRASLGTCTVSKGRVLMAWAPSLTSASAGCCLACQEGRWLATCSST